MTHPRFILTFRLTIAVLAVMAALLPDLARARAPVGGQHHHAAMAIHDRYAPGSSLVHCTLLRQPPRRAARRAVSRRAARFFAPTSQAVFFTHAGDRCVWRGASAVRG